MIVLVAGLIAFTSWMTLFRAQMWASMIVKI
ncbi:hypothetical protein Gohar_027733 [Gossypium harknessii]|uniref:Uncharacterized protein n=1 Tax=Gossypium harknessii TaxID=34285 RepID=A0A7J9HVQ6_9ROSI|nr:hypothetical protein [Gossypium harknessii]